MPAAFALFPAGVEIVDAGCDEELAELERMLVTCDDVATAICMYELRWPLAAYACLGFAISAIVDQDTQPRSLRAGLPMDSGSRVRWSTM